MWHHFTHFACTGFRGCYFLTYYIAYSNGFYFRITTFAMTHNYFWCQGSNLQKKGVAMEAKFVPSLAKIYFFNDRRPEKILEAFHS